MLRRALPESLWGAGYGVARRPDMIPIWRNPGEGAESPHATEREAQGRTPAELFQRLADEPRNAAIRDKIGETAATSARNR